MKFCNVCDNMYYIKIIKEDQQNKLTYFCKNCGNVEEKEKSSNNCVYTNNFNKESYYFKYKINKFTHLDPTLPKVNNITCPKTECEYNSESNKNKRVVYLKYNEEKMKYLYICCKCQTVWKTPEYGKQEIISN